MERTRSRGKGGVEARGFTVALIDPLRAMIVFRSGQETLTDLRPMQAIKLEVAATTGWTRGESDEIVIDRRSAA